MCKSAKRLHLEKREEQSERRRSQRRIFPALPAAALAKPVFAVIAAVRLLVAVAELDVVSARGGRWTRHVTQRAFVVAHCASKKKEIKSN